MGYGDLFVAGAFGGLLALHFARREQLRGAALTACLALGFDLLFLLVDELPATVPVALALIALALVRRRSRARARRVRRSAPGGRLARARLSTLFRIPVRRRS